MPYFQVFRTQLHMISSSSHRPMYFHLVMTAPTLQYWQTYRYTYMQDIVNGVSELNEEPLIPKRKPKGRFLLFVVQAF